MNILCTTLSAAVKTVKFETFEASQIWVVIVVIVIVVAAPALIDTYIFLL